MDPRDREPAQPRTEAAPRATPPGDDAPSTVPGGIRTPGGPPDGEPATASDDVPAALRAWRRYRVVARLGSGGMGEVFRAWDPQLQRWVALKFLHGTDPRHLARFQREAQAQARVDHPGVCRVYEVGEVDGRPFIAMQEIVGATLGQAGRELPLEERVRLVAQVADAVHAAHRIGLIHRDLKPGNILVATGEDGPQPYVVDFGLARDQRVSGLSVSGSLWGTPGYMAPEQAAGDDTAVDRRADVYALGAVLYELIAGQRPLPAENIAEALVKLLQEEPPRLALVAPSVPADLETVVMKCLEKDPARRYDSAKALAADLRRWLDGEPVEAQPAGRLYRLRKRLRRHPRIVAASALAALLIVALAGTALRARLQAGERAEAARRFGTMAKEMESTLRIGELAPPHDTRAERLAVRRAMARVEREMADMGPGARGAGLYALGRAALALGDSAEAVDRLQGAWDAGERGPEISYALGQALGQRYFAGLERLAPGRQAAGDAALRAGLFTRYGEPARRQLQLAAAGHAALDAPELLEAWLALYEGRYAAARAAAARALAGRPWLYEARHVEGLAWRREGMAAEEHGDIDAALAAYAQAATANAAAMAIARSGAQVHAEECARQAALLRALRQRRPFTATEVEGAVAACEAALALDTERAVTHGDEGRVLLTFAEEQMRAGIDPTAGFARAVAAFERQIALDERADDGWANLGTALLDLARWELQHGEPRAHLERSIAAYRHAIELERRSGNYNGLGNAQLVLARYLDAHGLPGAAAARRASIAALEQAIAIWDGYAAAYGNLGQAWVYVATAELAAGRDPRAALTQAIAIFERGLALNSALPAYLNNSGNAYLTLAEYRLALGEDPARQLALARARFHDALDRRPQYAIPLWNLAEADRLEALSLVRRGTDPARVLADGLAVLRRAGAIDGSDPDTPMQAARLELIAARWAVQRGLDAAPALARAGAHVAAARTLGAASADLEVTDAERWRRLATWEQRHGGGVAAAIASGLAAAGKALALQPGLAAALVERALLLRLQGDTAGADAALLAARKANPLVTID